MAIAASTAGIRRAWKWTIESKGPTHLKRWLGVVFEIIATRAIGLIGKLKDHYGLAKEDAEKKVKALEDAAVSAHKSKVA